MPDAGVLLIRAILMLLVGVSIAWRSLGQSLPPPSAYDVVHVPEDAGPIFDEDHPYFVSSQRMTFDTYPTQETLGEVARAAGAQLVRMAPEFLDRPYRIDGDRLEMLAGVFQAHLEVVLSGSYERWLAFIESFGRQFDAGPGEEGGPPTKGYFELNGTAYRLAPLSIEDMKIRPLYFRGRKMQYEQAPTTMQAMIRGPYGAPKAPGAQGNVYEILVPMQMRLGQDASDDEEPNRMNVGFAYCWDQGRGSWLPFQIYSYTDGGGRLLMYAY